jgi:hypothetical protein
LTAVNTFLAQRRRTWPRRACASRAHRPAVAVRLLAWVILGWLQPSNRCYRTRVPYLARPAAEHRCCRVLRRRAMSWPSVPVAVVCMPRRGVVLLVAGRWPAGRLLPLPTHHGRLAQSRCWRRLPPCPARPCAYAAWIRAVPTTQAWARLVRVVRVPPRPPLSRQLCACSFCHRPELPLNCPARS